VTELERASSELDQLAAAWRGGFEGEGFEGVCTPDVSYEDPVAVQPLRGAREIDAHARTLREAFPDLRVESTSPPLGRGGFACVPWRALGTHRGEVDMLPASERFVTLHGLHYLELSDGLVRRARGFFDLYDAATQLGLLPSRGGLGETALLLLRGFGLRRRQPPAT
jgi:hypothetical protein